MQDRKRHLVVADQHCLGNFEFEPVRRKPGGRERARDLQGTGSWHFNWIGETLTARRT